MLSVQEFKNSLFQQIDASSLSVFRIGFGVIMMYEVWRYWTAGWISRFYIEPTYHFKYYGFEWLHAWPGDGMYWHFAVLGVAAFFITIGFLFRISAIVFTIAFSYIFLLDQAKYLNHFYMVILFAITLCVLPANRHWSVDALIKTKLASETVPRWTVWLIRFQLEIILIYAGIVKINHDWLHLEPLSMWLAKRSDYFLLGDLFTQQWAIAVAAYGVIILHLVGAPLLLWKKTRLLVFFIYFLFHILNHFVFTIGIFPWFTLFTSLIFFDPNWPKQFRNRFRKWRKKSEIVIVDFDKNPLTSSQSTLAQNMVFSFLAIWIGFQLLFPLRHILYPGNVSWTEEGHRFSWQMKLRDKKAKASYTVTDPISQESWMVNPQNFLTRRQYRKMSTRPDMILQFAHFIRDEWAVEHGIQNPEVYVEVFASLNGRKAARLIDPNRDLARIERNLWTADWILPLTEPFKKLSD